jgi:hypothetical protein
MVELFAACAPAQAQHFAADEARIRRQLHPALHVCTGTIEHNAFLRQPFQRSACCDVEIQLLPGPCAGTAIPLAGARRGQQRMRARPDID